MVEAAARRKADLSTSPVSLARDGSGRDDTGIGSEAPLALRSGGGVGVLFFRLSFLGVAASFDG
jgi:hypothetical protein